MNIIKSTRQLKARLRMLLWLFFLALAIPSAILVWQAYSRLKWESLHQHQGLAAELVGRIDRQFNDWISQEEARSFTDYRFLIVEGDPSANYLQRSPLATYPVNAAIPGLLGYFQIDAQGRFSSPLLPEDATFSVRAYGIDLQEQQARQSLNDQLLNILRNGQQTRKPAASAVATSQSENAILDDEIAARKQISADTRDAFAGAPGSDAQMTRRKAGSEESTKSYDKSGTAVSQSVFDQLAPQAARQNKRGTAAKDITRGAIGRLDELKLDPGPGGNALSAPTASPRERQQAVAQQRDPRLERNALPQPPTASVADGEMEHSLEASPLPGQASTRIDMFESEIDPFEFGLLDSGHLVLYRKVWRDRQRYIQGALIETQALLRHLIEARFRETSLSDMSRLAVAFDGDILSALGESNARRYLSSAEQLAGSLLYRSKLSAPLGRMELLFTVTRLPSGPGASLLAWVSLILVAVLSGGLLAIYRLGERQIKLNEQQQDFVSAVSHELKTPLTSIRMYSEMLREGWADEARKRSYYDFIHAESERLTRLITNVLQLARMGHDGVQVNLRAVPIAELLDILRSKLATQCDQAGFSLDIAKPQTLADLSIDVDDDAFVQVFINLVDNAMKFSAKAEHKTIDIRCETLAQDNIRFRVRDYGPGIDKQQLKKIFVLFYRPENELTRETVGTGIGLALVHRLVTAMHGKVDVINREPGAEFVLDFPLLKRGR